jgi:SAM-dependent methyltransferase
VRVSDESSPAGDNGHSGFRRLVARIVSHPRVYRLQRRLLHAEKLDEQLTPLIDKAVGGAAVGTIVDVGGGSGTSRSLWPPTWTYIGIDPDERAVQFGQADENTERTVGSASNLPFPDGYADAVLMKEVSHHLDDETWDKTLEEIRRILKPGGTFVFLDGVWTRQRWISRLVWRFDVGRHPREAASIEADIAKHFELEDLARFAAIHHCIVLLARPRAATPAAGSVSTA